MARFQPIDETLTFQQRVQGLTLVLSDLPEPERLPYLAILEQAAKQDKDFNRLRAIEEYRKLHLPQDKPPA